MSLCLSDTSGKDDIHINDVLIEEGHAQFVADNPDLVYAEDPQVVGVIVQIRVMPLSILPHSHQCCSLNLHTIETPSLVLINDSIHFMVSLHLFAMENLCTDFNIIPSGIFFVVRHNGIIDTSVKMSVCYTLVQGRSERMHVPFQKGLLMVALVWFCVCSCIVQYKDF